MSDTYAKADCALRIVFGVLLITLSFVCGVIIGIYFVTFESFWTRAVSLGPLLLLYILADNILHPERWEGL